MSLRDLIFAFHIKDFRSRIGSGMEYFLHRFSRCVP